MCNIVDGGTEYAFLEKYIFYSNLNRHYAIMKHMDARDKEKEDSDEKQRRVVSSTLLLKKTYSVCSRTVSSL